MLRQKEKGVAAAGWAVEKISSTAQGLGPTPEAARRDGEIIRATFEGLQREREAKFELHFDDETGATQITLPAEHWDRLGIRQEKAGYLIVGLEFRPVVGGVREMEPSRNNHGDIFFLGVPLDVMESTQAAA